MTDTTPATPGEEDLPDGHDADHTDYPELAPDAAGQVAARLDDLDEDLIAKRSDALRAGLADYDLDDDDLELLEGATVGDDGIITMPALPVLAIVWALIDRSRWATVILGVAAITVAVMLYRMNQIWFIQVFTPVV
jgi:hypothetical protein